MTTTTTPSTFKITPAYIENVNRRFVYMLRDGGIVKASATDAPAPAPGWYRSDTGDITLDASVDFGTDLTADGVVIHEASHSIWSNWLTRALINSKAVTPAELSVLKLLEEARIETKAVDTYHNAARFALRASYGHLLADGFSDPNNYVSVSGAVSCWALAWGRTHSGVVDPVELDEIDVLMRERFGDYPMDCLDDLLAEFCTLRFGTLTGTSPVLSKRALSIAQEWLDIVRMLQDDEGGMSEEEMEKVFVRLIEDLLGDEAGTGAGEGTDESEDGEGTGTGTGEKADEGEGSGEGGGKDADGSIEVVTHGDGGSEEQFGWADKFVEVVKSVSETPTKDADVRTMSPRAKLARIWKKPRKSSNWIQQDPTAEHHRLITRMAKAFEKDATPAVVRERVKSQLPPGKLNGRGAMAAAADRAGGRMTTAQPWRANKRHHVERPPVIIGVATDTSGSMASYSKTLGDAAYVVAHAGRRVNAKFAAATFGVVAEPVVSVGEVPDKVRIRSANSGHEAFDDAMAALDGPLRLTDKSVIGRKLLIVVSDAELVRANEVQKALIWLRNLHKAGTDVIWIGVDGLDPEQPGYYTPALVRLCKDERIPVKFASTVANAEEFVDMVLENLRAA